MTNSLKCKSGFTLIELLIVVAIIGVLAAIAIPQFNKYRINGFNASAISGVHNMRTAQESLFTEYGRYGATAVGNVPGPGSDTGATVTGPGTGVISTMDNILIPRGIIIPVGSKITICASAVPVVYSAFNAVAKHTQGDSAFGLDSDSTAISKHADFPAAATAINYSINPADVPSPIAGTLEFTLALGWVAL